MTTLRLLVELDGFIGKQERAAAQVREQLESAGYMVVSVAALKQRNEVAERAEEIHAEHHPGTFVPSLDSCTEHTRAEYEQMVRDLLEREQP